MTDKEVMQQEPVACRFCHSKKGCWTWQCYHCGEIDDVQQPALPLPVQEPVAWMTINEYGEEDDIHYENPEGHLLEGWTYKPLYTHAPTAQRPWQGLTDEEIFHADPRIGTSDSNVNPYQILINARAIEAKLKEKNA